MRLASARPPADAREGESDYHHDPDRVLLAWADWPTLRQMAWHPIDTETRYDLAALDVAPPCADELTAPAGRLHRHGLPAPECLEWEGVRQGSAGVWIARTVLRRLA